MGINIVFFDYIYKHLYHNDIRLPSSRVCLLGNLHFKKGTRELREKFGTKSVHKWLEDIGTDVVTVDKNGLDGALRLDLEKPLRKHIGTFDVIIDGGTTEHVKDHMACFKNVHEICNTGGLMFHMLPLEGHWRGHCHHRYTEQFFRGLATAYSYSVVDIRINTYMGPGKHLVFACLRKQPKVRE